MRGNCLVASGQRDHRVEHVAAPDEFDGIGDDFAAHERSPHAVRAHGFAVADGDRVELHRSAAGCAHALLHFFREVRRCELHGIVSIQVLAMPTMRLWQVGIRKTDGPEIGASWRA